MREYIEKFGGKCSFAKEFTSSPALYGISCILILYLPPTLLWPAIDAIFADGALLPTLPKKETLKLPLPVFVTVHWVESCVSSEKIVDPSHPLFTPLKFKVPLPGMTTVLDDVPFPELSSLVIYTRYSQVYLALMLTATITAACCDYLEQNTPTSSEKSIRT